MRCGGERRAPSGQRRHQTERPANIEMQLTSGGWARASRAHFIKRRLQLISVLGGR